MAREFTLRRGCEFYPYDGDGSGDEFIIRTPERRQFRISRLAKDILVQLNAGASFEEIALSLGARGQGASADQLRALVNARYANLGIFESPDSQGVGGTKAGRASKRSISLLLHWGFIPERYVCAVSARFKGFYSRPVALMCLLAIVAAHLGIYLHPGHVQKLSSTAFVYVFLLCIGSVLWHELGHASALTKFGGAPGKIGFGLFILTPVFYADVSQVWCFRRRQRIVVDLAGVYFQELAFVAFAVLAWLTSAPQYVLACRFIDVMVFVALNPVFQFDGYWVLVDYLALPNLYGVALGYIKDCLLRLKFSGTSLPPMRRRRYLVFVLYAAVSNVFMGAIIWMSYQYLRTALTQLPKVLPGLYMLTLSAARTHDFALLLSCLIKLFFAAALLGSVLAGISIYAISLGTYCAEKLGWRAGAAARNQNSVRASGHTDPRRTAQRAAGSPLEKASEAVPAEPEGRRASRAAIQVIERATATRDGRS